MATEPGSTGGGADLSRRGTRGNTSSRLSTETKHSTKTSELVVYVVITVAILICAAAIKGGDTSGGEKGGTDEFIASQAWLYVSIVTLGYLLSRGLAKSGSREPYYRGGSNEQHDHDRD